MDLLPVCPWLAPLLANTLSSHHHWPSQVKTSLKLLQAGCPYYLFWAYMSCSNLGGDLWWFNYVRDYYILWREIASQSHECQEPLHILSGYLTLPSNRKANSLFFFLISWTLNFEDVFSMSLSHGLHPGFDHTSLATLGQKRQIPFFFFFLHHLLEIMTWSHYSFVCSFWDLSISESC